MCRFDLLIHPEGPVPEALLRVEGRRYSATRLPELARKLPPGSRIAMTGRSCDCGSWLGRWRDPEPPPDREPQLQAEAERLRRRGWGEHKVQRWLEQRRLEKPGSPPPRDGVPDEIQRWLRLLATLVRHFPWVGLYLHEFQGGPTEERFPVRHRRELRMKEVDADTLLHLEEDVLYLFRS